jgi:PAS domain S-box-containing protein
VKKVRREGLSRPNSGELAELRARLSDAEEALLAIQRGEVDAVVVEGKQGPQVFTLEGEGHAYRMLIESMNEGALTLTTDKRISYANRCFARLVKRPLEQVMGSSLRALLSAEDASRLHAVLKEIAPSGAKLQVLLNAGDGSRIPVQLSVRTLARRSGAGVIIGMVVTDLTEARRNEEMLRALSHRLLQAQDAERGRVALELHDHITQLLCAIVVRCQTLAETISARDGPSQGEAIHLREMLGQAADQVERISRELRPSVLQELGLVPVMRETAAAFAVRTGLSIALDCGGLTARLPAEIELVLYRILQEALRNVERHAGARHVAVHLSQPGAFARLRIHDDGIGFETDLRPTRRRPTGGLGLLSMRERAAYVGGAVKIKSLRRGGTEIEVQVPLPSKAPPPTPRAQSELTYETNHCSASR